MTTTPAPDKPPDAPSPEITGDEGEPSPKLIVRALLELKKRRQQSVA